jgi:hypothetical protein
MTDYLPLLWIFWSQSVLDIPLIIPLKIVWGMSLVPAGPREKHRPDVMAAFRKI